MLRAVVSSVIVLGIVALLVIQNAVMPGGLLRPGSDDRGLRDFDVSAWEQREWEKRIKAALAPSPCPAVPAPLFPSGYYTGALIDTHLHIPALDDSSPGDNRDDDRDDVGEGDARFGGPQALLGRNITMSRIACSLLREGTMKNFAFFPVYDSIPKQLALVWKKTMQTYPTHFTPFLMTPGVHDETPTLNAAFVENVLSYYPGLFTGYGEIGLYALENVRDAFPPTHTIFRDIYPIVKRNKLAVYFHPGDRQTKDFARLLAAEPDIPFIVHGDEIQGDITSLMNTYPNIYYGVDAFWGPDMDLFHAFVGESKAAYLTMMEKEFDAVLAYEVKKWKPIIEKHPDRFLWGTDRGDAVWNYDLEVGQLMVKFARAFIGRLDPQVQEKIAYKNAEAMLAQAEAMQNRAVTVGYIGCSNTRQTVEGYQLLGGTKMWPYDKRYDSGTVVDWAKNTGSGNAYWNTFDGYLADHPNTRAIWWQLCIRDENRETGMEHAQRILDAIRARMPGVTVYVSALADYTDGVCSLTGTFGLEKANELVRALDAANKDVLPGPVLGPMTPADTDADGCHLSSPDGKRKLGTQMLEFFE